MPGARGQMRRRRPNIECLAVVAAELHARMPTGDAESLMHGRMIVADNRRRRCVHIAAPAIGAEQPPRWSFPGDRSRRSTRSCSEKAARVGDEAVASNTKVRGLRSSLTTDMIVSEIVGWAMRLVRRSSKSEWRKAATSE